MTTETTTVHEVWLENPDGTSGQAVFLSSPESYDTREKAERYAKRYNDEQIGWKVPEDQRRRFYVKSFNITREEIPEP